MELWIGALNLGLLYAFMAIGVFITFRVQNFPDITVDGSFTAGAATAAVLIVSGVNPFLALLPAFLVGAAAGAATALIHTRLNINGLLAGILVMTGLYSINLHIMGRSNIPLLTRPSFVSFMEKLNPGLSPEIWLSLGLLVVMGLFWLGMSLFFRTDLGLRMRATGNNPSMAAATGVNVERMTILAIALANGLVAVSGCLVAQYQGFADIGMGLGTVVVGLAAVIIGESVLRSRSIQARILSAVVGSVIFRFMIALALSLGMNPVDLKLLTAAFVLITLIVSRVAAGKKRRGRKAFLPALGDRAGKRVLVGAMAAVLITAVLVVGLRRVRPTPGRASGLRKVGLLQVSDNGLLNITRDSFVEEMKRLGYQPGKNCLLYLENANGDLATVNTILDKFVYQDLDVIVPLSTACTQAALNRVQDRPVVFATVADPFIIGAGRTETDHRANVTGVYGSVPMDETLEIVRRILPGNLRLGAIWDPAQANSVFNVTNLQKAVARSAGVTFAGATITGSSEVYQAASSLVSRGVQAFVLSPDNIVYSAFESVVKAAAPRKIPIILSDVERLEDGALCTYGYDYSSSGIQAAHLVDRVLKGESPRGIPFERYKKITLGLNLKVAAEIGLAIPPDLLARATKICGRNPADSRPGPDGEAPRPPGPSAAKKRLALFLFNDQEAIRQTADGVLDELAASGILDRKNVKVDIKNAQNEFPLAQSIAQEIVQQKYDCLVTLTTRALQVAARANKNIPHVFGCVTDPYRTGVAKDPADHLPHLTGVATLQPVEATIRAMRQLFPGARTIGLVWNPAEASSEACTERARRAARECGFRLWEATVAGSSEVVEALRSLLGQKVDVFFTSGDNTVTAALVSVAEILRQHRIPYFTNSPADVGSGALVSIGADYYEVGRETGRLAVRVLDGENPKNIPIKDFAPEKIAVNLGLAESYGLRIPEEFLKRASYVRR
jgi:putative ABC transport system permease protein